MASSGPPYVPVHRYRDRTRWLWLTSRKFRQCWRAFGRRSSKHPYLRSNAGVIAFWRQPLPEFLADYDAATQAEYGFDDWMRRARGIDAMYGIYLASDPAPDDPHHWLKRELYVFGHPAADEPILRIESAVRM